MRNFGPSFQTEQAMEEIESAVCTDIHEERKLLFTDGTTKKVDVKALKTNKSTVYTGKSLTDYTSAASANSDLNKYDVVSYTVNSDEEYTLTLAADARNAAVGSAKITKGIPSLASTVSDNRYNVGTTNGGVLYANGKTTFLVIDESGTDTTYTSYTGIANVPNIRSHHPAD